ncbi:Metallo-dependent hydrolase [Obba rivulosa]|uniref:Metallo-dependent hydrolase n=1 Tax=Obba rivulosa TaxID=1052685 RepID=A0A8E2DR33_9APHY|nr:Metallo-dependent hydrolase [Obba rivulosa]
MPYLLKGGIVATFTNKNKPTSYRADVLVEGSTITKIAENIDAAPGVEVVDCTGKWITPGMVDTHRHVFMAVLRGSQCDWLLTEYFVKMTWNIQGALTLEETRIGQLAGCLEALHSGVTTLLDHFHAAMAPGHAEAALAATIASGARVVWCPARQSQPTRLFPSIEYGKEEETREWQMQMLKEWGKNGGQLTPDGRVTFGWAYDLVGSGPVEVHQEAIKQGRQAGVALITAHVVQGPRILVWRDAGLLGPDVVFSHCTELADHPEPDDEMWAAMKDHGCAIAATPEDELGMAHGNPVAFDAVRRGVKCGLGVDAISINGGDLFTQMRFALQWARGRSHEQFHLFGQTPPMYNEFNSADAFRLATLGGAEAMNMQHLIGTVEVGKKADLVVFDTGSVNLAGIADPFKGVVFHASSEDVELVMVDGEIVKRNGKLTKADWNEVAEELRQRAQDIRERFPDEKLDEMWKKYYEQHPGGPQFR